MPRRNIELGNAADVMQHGRNVTIIPEEQASPSLAADNQVKVALRYYGLDIVNGGPAPNPDAISVDSTSFPGWKIEKYNDQTGTVPMVEIIDNTDENWEDAWLVVSLEHSGATLADYDFTVTSATIESVTPSTSNVTRHYAAPGNVSSTTGTYALHIATTVDGVRKMIAQFNAADWHENYYDEEYLEANKRTTYPYRLFLTRKSLPEDRKLSLAGWDDTFRFLLEVVP